MFLLNGRLQAGAWETRDLFEGTRDGGLYRELLSHCSGNQFHNFFVSQLPPVAAANNNQPVAAGHPFRQRGAQEPSSEQRVSGKKQSFLLGSELRLGCQGCSRWERFPPRGTESQERWSQPRCLG